MSDSTHTNILVLVRRVLREVSLKSKVNQKKSKLIFCQIKTRLEFSKYHCHWIDDDWDCVIFFDKTKVNHFCSDSCNWSWFHGGQSISAGMVQ